MKRMTQEKESAENSETFRLREEIWGYYKLLLLEKKLEKDPKEPTSTEEEKEPKNPFENPILLAGLKKAEAEKRVEKLEKENLGLGLGLGLG